MKYLIIFSLVLRLITPQLFESLLPPNIPSPNLPKFLESSSKTPIQAELYKENTGGTPLPASILAEITPKVLSSDSLQSLLRLSLSDYLESQGFSMRNGTFYLNSEARIALSNNTTISLKEIEKLLAFNKRLIRKCGGNLEFCMIKDNGLAEVENNWDGMRFLEGDNENNKLEDLLEERINEEDENLEGFEGLEEAFN